MLKIKQLVLIILLFGNCTTAFGFTPDSTINNRFWGVNVYSGILQYHHKEMEIMQEKRVDAIEFSYIFIGDGSKLWHTFYNFPKFGITYKFMDLGSPSILGYSHSIYPFVTFPLYSPFKKINFGLHVGPGLSYATKIYHRTENFKNSAISSHLNAYINLGFKANFSISEQISIGAGFHLVHYSNGTFKKPNSGLNYSLISLGLIYAHKKGNVQNDASYSFTDRQNRILLVGTGSYKEIKGAGGPKYDVGAFSVEYSRPIKTLWRYGVSMDVMYDESNAFTLDYEGVPWTSNWQLLKTGLTLNTEVILNKLSAVFYFGGYIYNISENSDNGPVYQRIGLRYRVIDRMWLHLALKTHWGSADYVELGAAFKIL